MSALVRTLFPHGWAALGGLIAALVAVALVSLVWPGGYPSDTLLIAGLVAVCVVSIVVSRIAAMRHPYFHTREDVEAALGLPVLGTCRARKR